jgi:putative ABC transport system permease protein
VLGETAKVNLLGYGAAVGRYVKVNEVWLRVIGVMAPAATAEADIEGLEMDDRNNMVIAPLNSVMRRFEDNNSYLRDEIDGIFVRVASDADPIETAEVVRAILTATHNDAGDFSITVPAGLLAQKRQQSRILEIVMICIASISLLVGGIGIMNIMLATVLERTREIGIRRAIGARQRDIVRQFLIEAVLISILGGLLGIAAGFTAAKIIELTAQMPTVVSMVSIVVAFGVSVAVGLLFGIYPAMQAAKLDPIEAIRYE